MYMFIKICICLMLFLPFAGHAQYERRQHNERHFTLQDQEWQEYEQKKEMQKLRNEQHQIREEQNRLEFQQQEQQQKQRMFQIQDELRNQVKPWQYQPQ